MHWTSPNGIQTGAGCDHRRRDQRQWRFAARVREGQAGLDRRFPVRNFVNEFRFGWMTDRQTDDINPALTGAAARLPVSFRGGSADRVHILHPAR